ncbi:MAG: YgiQ family radical SAM protein [Deltaproteobacteria bacterium]|nr:YgiQ family radical SAM protein [Deltaproteobacteria bacterium]TLN02509.1 MAG: YgiQ family radical SAM protein [bacterium]
MPFLPITREEACQLGWPELDIIFVSGDAYIDHPSFGIPLLARLLESRGFRVGIIPQPDWRTKESFMVLGRPKLFFAVSAGAMDSMVAHYTPARKLRRDDAYTPGNRHGARPNRAAIVYTSRLKEAFKDVPVVLGGIEASLRRFAHYDYWEDRVRRSILFDAKADLLVYGMGEHPLLEIAEGFRRGEALAGLHQVRGTAWIGDINRLAAISGTVCELPSWEDVSGDKRAFVQAFRLTEQQMNSHNGSVVVQKHGDRYLICNAPALALSPQELDEVYALPFEKAPHPSYKEPIPAYEQIRASITTHRGCLGGCAFCAITHHQGKVVQSRSEASILQEVGKLASYPWFKGTVTDLGGPTANMYGAGCCDENALRKCQRPSCIYPALCKNLRLADRESASLLKKARNVPGVKHVAVASGVRFDLFSRQPEYLRELLSHHVGGLLKVAPEHLVDTVTKQMRKPGREVFERFLAHFRTEIARLGKRYAVVPYLMSGHPGCTLNDMVDAAVILKRLGLKVEQVQDFTPTPGTLSTCIYHTGLDPYSGKNVYVAKSDREKSLQKSLLLYHLPQERAAILKALEAAGRKSVAQELLPRCVGERVAVAKGRVARRK